jgi:rubrerythrin
MHGWICKSCGNRILENEPDEHNPDCPQAAKYLALTEHIDAEKTA